MDQKNSSSIPTYTPTFNPQVQQQLTSQSQMNPGMIGQPVIQAPTLTPTDMNSNLFQNFAPPMNYKFFTGDVNTLPNYYQQMQMPGMPGPMSPVASPMAAPMSPVAAPMTGPMTTPMAAPMSPVAAPMAAPMSPAAAPMAAPMSPVAAPMSNYKIDVSSLPNYIN